MPLRRGGAPARCPHRGPRRRGDLGAVRCSWPTCRPGTGRDARSLGRGDDRLRRTRSRLAPGALDDALTWQQLELGDLDTVVEGLLAAISAPLGPTVDGVRLPDIGRADRVDELGFELPLVGGDGTPRAQLADVADVARAHLAPDDPMDGYAPRLPDPP